MPAEIRIVKRKARGFFKPSDIKTIKETVHDVHQILTNASVLVRAYYLKWFQQNHPLQDDRQPLELDHHTLSVACNIVQGATSPSVRGTGDKTGKVAIFNDILETYKDLYERLPNCPNITSEHSLSHILAYSLENLLTAYENNITTHFPKYPKRFILCDLLSKNVDLATAKKVAWMVTNHFLYDLPLEALPEVNVSLEKYEFLFPAKMTVKGFPRSWDLRVHPFTYLYKMVMINQALETDFTTVDCQHRKLLNPLPFHSSFVPMHVRLDTSGISQLLMTKERISEFKRLYEVEHPGATLNMNNKSDMLASFEKLLGRPPSTKEEAGMYATDMWAFLTNLRTCKHWEELNGYVRKNDPKKVQWVFDNAVVTDGVSVSFQVINRNAFGRKIMSGKKKGEKSKHPEPEVEDVVTVQDLSNYKVLGCDPGKRDIMAVTDGHTTLRYTRGQRDQDTFKAARTKETLRRRRVAGLEAYETQVLNRFPKRSCHLDVFKRYVFLRKRNEAVFLEAYGHPVFRQLKFTTYCKAKSSEHRFVNRVTQEFSKPSSCPAKRCMTEQMVGNASKEVYSASGLLIGWGNWGKAPNTLKGSAPSPGIGIRKRFESFFKTITVNEYMTSQTCPCCRGEGCLRKSTIVSVQRHHLLRCTNDACQSRWWNRNVVGSFNILRKLMEQLPGNETAGVGRGQGRRPRPTRKQPQKSRT